MSFKDDPRYYEYRRKFVRETIKKAKPEHMPYVTVHTVTNDAFTSHAALIWWWNDQEKGFDGKLLPGFWEPLDKDQTWFDALEDARTKAQEWAKELGIEYKEPPQP